MTILDKNPNSAITNTTVCARYIERNPVRAKVVRKACSYKWSSARVHCGIESKDIFGVNKFFDVAGEKKDGWQEFIEQPDNPQDITEIRIQTIKGRPLGEESFVRKLERKLNRFLIVKPAGRPKEKKK